METIAELKYKGPMHEISFTKPDFDRHGVEDQGAVKFNGDNNWVAEVSDEAADLLYEQFPGNFRPAEESDKEEADLTRVNSVVKPQYGRKAKETVEVEKADASTTTDSQSGKAVRTSEGSTGTGGRAGRGATAGRAT